MSKIQYSVYKQETGSAGGKAKNDCYDILCSCGFKPSYVQSDSRIIRILKQIISINQFKKDDILVVQYPTISPQVMPFLLKKLKKINNTIGIIHDIPALQGMGGDISSQIDELNHFKYLIVHNKYMAEKLVECGCKATMVPLEAFDYLHDFNHPVENKPYQKTICVAGNLDKSKYLLQISAVNHYSFKLYGIKKTIDFTGIGNVDYKGLLPSDQIQYLLEGDYGLIWDGDSINTCSDIHGEYLKINNPHKMSLYLAAGKPVITWQGAAIADYILKNRIGIVVDSLVELNKIDLAKNYKELKRNAMILKERISKGYYLKNAIEAVAVMINKTGTEEI